MDGGVDVFPDQFFVDQDGVLEVVAAPGHEGHQDVAAEGEFAFFRALPVGDHLPLLDPISLRHQGFLVDAGVLVGALELVERVDVDAGFLALSGLVRVAADAHDDALRVYTVDDAVALGENHGPGIAGGHGFHARAHHRRLGHQQRHRLALHVGAHQGAVGVVVFEEGDQGRRHADQLLGRNVDEIDVVAVGEDEVPPLAGVDVFVHDEAVLVQLDRGLGDDEALFLPRRHVEGLDEEEDWVLAFLLQFDVVLLHLPLLDHFPDLVVGVAAVHDLHVIDDPPFLDFPVGRLDETEFIDPREAGQRADQTDVRTFRGLDGAQPAVVARVHVAHLEAGPLAREAAGPEGRKAPLVGDFRQRVGLVHELGQLGRAEEFLEGRHDGLRIDQVVRHDGSQLLVHRHLFLDGPFHAHQADAELVLQQFAHGADAAVAEVVDVIGLPVPGGEEQEVAQHVDEVGMGQDPLVQGIVLPELQVGLQPPDPGEVVALRVEEHPVEHGRGHFQGRRVAGAELLVELQHGLFGRGHMVLFQGFRKGQAARVEFREADVDLPDAVADHLVDQVGVDRLVRFTQDLARLHVDDVVEQDGAVQVLGGQEELFVAGVLKVLQVAHVEPLAHLVDDVRRVVGVRQALAELAADERFIQVSDDLAVLQFHGDAGIEQVEDLLVGLVAERLEEDGGQQLALPVDADGQDVLVVELEFDPRTPVGNDLAQEIVLFGFGLEKHARGPVQLADDHPFGPVDDERAAGSHEGDVPEEDFLLLDVANGLGLGLLVDVPQDEAHRHLQRDGIVHPPVDALFNAVFDLEFHRIAAGVAAGKPVLVPRAALGADDVPDVLGVGGDGRTAVLADRTQMLDPYESAALALPVP